MLTSLIFAASLAGGTPPVNTSPDVPSVPPMTVNEYLAMVDSLQMSDAGPGGSEKSKLVINEILAAGAAYKASVKEARDKGKPPRGCPPEHFNLSGEALFPPLRALTPEQRQLDIRDGVAIVFDKLFACPKAGDAL